MLKDIFKCFRQSKLPRPALYPFPFEFQVLLQVIGDCREVHHLVRLCEPYRIYLSQAHELGEGAEDGFDRALSLALHVPSLRTLHPCHAPFILITVIGDAELFLLCTFAKAPLPYGAARANVLSCTVLLLLNARSVIIAYLKFIACGFPKRKSYANCYL